MSAVANLDELCPLDGRPIGAHTLAEWWDDAHSRRTEVEYEDVPDGPIQQAIGDAAVADHLTARATVLTGQTGPNGKVIVPVLMLDFAVGRPLGPPATVARVALMSDPAMMRKFGRLLRDTANGAANAAERAA